LVALDFAVNLLFGFGFAACLVFGTLGRGDCCLVCLGLHHLAGQVPSGEECLLQLLLPLPLPLPAAFLAKPKVAFVGAVAAPAN
jgi:hypothetical protein